MGQRHSCCDCDVDLEAAITEIPFTGDEVPVWRCPKCGACSARSSTSEEQAIVSAPSDFLAPWERALVDLLKAHFAPDILDRFAKETDLSQIAHVAREEILETPRKKYLPLKWFEKFGPRDSQAYAQFQKILRTELDQLVGQPNIHEVREAIEQRIMQALDRHFSDLTSGTESPTPEGSDQ